MTDRRHTPLRGLCRLVPALALVAIALLAPPARAQGMIFRWVDRQGNLHLTDELADVPEPYYGLYRARLRELEEKKKAEGGGTPAAPSAPPAAAPAPAPSGPSIVDQEAASRRRWKELVAYWRAELSRATDELAAADERLGSLRSNAILAQTPEVRASIEQATAARDKALSRLEAARRMLLDELPARAKRESVPPAWLM